MAIKKIKGGHASWNDCLNMPEVTSLQKLNQSIFLVKLREMIHNKKDNEVNIVFEYCDRNLFQEVTDRSWWNNQFREEEIKAIMFQALASVSYLHLNGYMHRDIKPENFLISHQKQNIKTIFNNSSQESIHETNVI